MPTPTPVCRFTRCIEPIRRLRRALAIGLAVVAACGAAACGQELPEGKVLSGNDLLTKDNVALRGTYYYPKSDVDKKEIVPVVFLHSSRGSRDEFGEVPQRLAGLGHAVLVPDLRGHGESTRLGIGNITEELDARKQKLAPAVYTAMVAQDLEAVKRFLVAENNAGKLNIEKLCLVGSEMGAAVALNWAAYDWSWPVLPGRKQGQFAKGIVLLSPPWSFPGLTVADAVKHPALHKGISVMILVGNENDKAAKDAKRIHTSLQRSRPAPGTLSPEDAEQTKDLFFKALPTELQGSKLLAVRTQPTVDAIIANFIRLRLVNKDYPWSEVVTKKKESAEK
jgi:pimeloyl-ACP methyl ester carboxylesterase